MCTVSPQHTRQPRRSSMPSSGALVLVECSKPCEEKDVENLSDKVGTIRISPTQKEKILLLGVDNEKESCKPEVNKPTTYGSITYNSISSTSRLDNNRMSVSKSKHHLKSIVMIDSKEMNEDSLQVTCVIENEFEKQ